MIDKLKYIVQNAVKKAVYREPEIPDDKKQSTTNIATDSLTDSISNYLKKFTSASSASPSTLASPSTSASPSASGTAKTTSATQQNASLSGSSNNDILSGIKSKTVAILISKANLNPQLAQKLTDSAMDAIMKALPLGNLNAGSLFSQTSQNSNSGKGFLESIGNIFNKNR